VRIETFRLYCDDFSVEARLLEVNGRWLASVDTEAGPTLGCGRSALAALWAALEPYDDVIGDLISTLPSNSLEPGDLDE
jgi:hypothetical protein